MIAFWNFLKGRKTYIVGLVTILYALSGWWTGHLSSKDATDTILAALGGMSLRHGISGVVEKMMLSAVFKDTIKKALDSAPKAQDIGKQ